MTPYQKETVLIVVVAFWAVSSIMIAIVGVEAVVRSFSELSWGDLIPLSFLGWVIWFLISHADEMRNYQD